MVEDARLTFYHELDLGALRVFISYFREHPDANDHAIQLATSCYALAKRSLKIGAKVFDRDGEEFAVVTDLPNFDLVEILETGEERRYYDIPLPQIANYGEDGSVHLMISSAEVTGDARPEAVHPEDV